MIAFAEEQRSPTPVPVCPLLPRAEAAYSEDGMVEAMQARLEAMEKEIVRVTNIASETRDPDNQQQTLAASTTATAGCTRDPGRSALSGQTRE